MNIKSIFSFVSRLSGRERVIFYATISVVSLLILDRLILTPILAKIQYLNETIAAQEEAIEQSLIIVTQEKRIEKERDRYTKYLSKPQVEEKAITAFLKEVEMLAKKSSIYLTDMKPSIHEFDGDNKRYLVRLSFEAQMEQVVNFFYNISSFEKLLKIENYVVKPKQEGSSIIECTASISKTIILE